MAYMMGRIMVICLMAIISTGSSPLGDSRPLNEQLKPVTLDEKSPIKKAYTYVSEYKRLPVFNFGIGKRWSNGNKGPQPYSFGFGKRSPAATLYPVQMDVNYLPYDSFDNYLNDDISDDGSRQKEPNNIKRSGRIRMYDFGLGKRMIPHFDKTASNENQEDSQALRKFLNDDLNQRFIFGSRNRFADDQEDIQEGD